MREATLEEKPNQKSSRPQKRQVTGSSEVDAKQGSTIGESQEISMAAEEYYVASNSNLYKQYVPTNSNPNPTSVVLAYDATLLRIWQRC